MTTGIPAAAARSEDQAARLRRLVDESLARHAADPLETPARPPAPARTAAGRIVAVASGKGGVGKTSIAVNLALALADRGKQTTILDADLGLGNADVLCGLPPGPHLGLVIEGRLTLREVTRAVAPRVRLVPGGSGIARLADLDPPARRRIADALHELERSCDILIADCGAGIGPAVLDIASSADAALIVTTPEPTALADAYGLIKCIAARAAEPASLRLTLAVNQCRNQQEARAVHARLAAVADRFLAARVHLLGWVASDLRLAESVRNRRPLIASAPRAPASICVRDLSASLLAYLGDAQRAPSAGGGLFSRLVARLRS